MPSNGRIGVEARMRVPFMDTTGKCLQLFFMHLKSGIATLEIRSISENITYETLFESTESEDLTRPFWRPVFVHLPDGIHMIMLRGVRKQGVSGIVVDDLRILPCADFGKRSMYNPM